MTYLDRQGTDLVTLFEACEYPAEFLRNPAHWLEAEKMEDLLAFIRRDYTRFSREGNIIQEAGHQCKDLRSWGVLDSVLRMVQSPKDIFSQPDRFMSYFVSPAPPVGNILREPSGIFFELPIAASQYPLVTEYLCAALEALPTYVDKPMATVEWTEIRVAISWSENQVSLFGEDQAPAPHLNPEIVQGILHNLETTQKQLEDTKLQLAERDRQLKQAQLLTKSASGEVSATVSVASGELSPSLKALDAFRWKSLAQGLTAEISVPSQEVLNHIYRLNDYMARAQQLVTLLVGQGRLSPQVVEAMRRVDWAFVQAESGHVVKQAAVGIRKLQDVVKDLGQLAADRELAASQAPRAERMIERKVPTDVNSLVQRAVENVRTELIRGHLSSVQIDQHLLLDREIPVYAKPLERALTNLFKNAVQSINGKGSVRVVTRPNGARAEIEITDTGIGMDDKTLARAFEPFFSTQTPGRAGGLGLSMAQSIVRTHEGSLTITSQLNRGTTVLVSLPLTATLATNSDDPPHNSIEHLTH